jgi:hypothetical protein
MNKYIQTLCLTIVISLFGSCGAGATGAIEALMKLFLIISWNNCNTSNGLTKPNWPYLTCAQLGVQTRIVKKKVCGECRKNPQNANQNALFTNFNSQVTEIKPGFVAYYSGQPIPGSGLLLPFDTDNITSFGTEVTVPTISSAPQGFEERELESENALVCGGRTAPKPNYYAETCMKYTEKQFEKRAKIVGYDLAASEPPPGVKSLSPQNNSIIYENENINIEFTDSLKSDFLTVTSNVSTALRNDYRLVRKVNYNDSLKLETNPLWPLGSFKNFIISSTDLNDKPVSVPLNFHVIKVGSAKTPSYNTCENGCKISWNGASEIQFEASGGVPPYSWRAITTPPPELAHLNLPNGSMPPSASFSNSGFFRSTGTWNFLPNAKWGAVILVTDSIGQAHFKLIQFDSYDEAATLAACLLSGACG